MPPELHTGIGFLPEKPPVHSGDTNSIQSFRQNTQVKRVRNRVRPNAGAQEKPEKLQIALSVLNGIQLIPMLGKRITGFLSFHVIEFKRHFFFPCNQGR